MAAEPSRARLEDLPALLALYGQLHPEDPPLDAARARQTFEQIFASPALGLFVAEAAGTVRATCYLNVIPNLTRSARPYAIIENVVTGTAHEGRGLGRAVIAHALAEAWRADCHQVMLMTGSSPPRTHRFYEACGFERGSKTGHVARPPQDRETL